MKNFPRNNSAVKPKRIKSAFNSRVQQYSHQVFSPTNSVKNNLNNLHLTKYPFNNESKAGSIKIKKEISNFFLSRQI